MIWVLTHYLHIICGKINPSLCCCRNVWMCSHSAILVCLSSSCFLSESSAQVKRVKFYSHLMIRLIWLFYSCRTNWSYSSAVDQWSVQSLCKAIFSSFCGFCVVLWSFHLCCDFCDSFVLKACLWASRAIVFWKYLDCSLCLDHGLGVMPSNWSFVIHYLPASGRPARPTNIRQGEMALCFHGRRKHLRWAQDERHVWSFGG